MHKALTLHVFVSELLAMHLKRCYLLWRLVTLALSVPYKCYYLLNYFSLNSSRYCYVVQRHVLLIRQPNSHFNLPLTRVLCKLFIWRDVYSDWLNIISYSWGLKFVEELKESFCR